MAATTVCNTPDDGRKLRPKHVQLKKPNKKEEKLHLVGIYITSKYMHLQFANSFRVSKLPYSIYKLS